MKKYLSLFLVAACGSSSGTNNTSVDAPNNLPADAAKVFMDAPPSVPATIVVSGTATQDDNTGSSPLSGVTIGFFKASDDSMLATATSNATGVYSMSISTGGQVVDGYVKATKSTFADNYTYATAPLQADSTIDSALVTSANFGGLGFLTGQMTTMGFVAVVVLDGSGQPVQGATVVSAPASGKYEYSNSSGVPDGNATATNTNGQAYFINVPSGNLTVNAAKSGITFKSHVVKGHPGALTTTTITP